MNRPLLTRPAVRDLLARTGAGPRRSLGQNFVVDPNTVRRIARLAGVGPGDHVVEVGAGLGSLTLALVETGANVLAVETDRRLVPLLTEVVGSGAAIVHADARQLDWHDLFCAHGNADGDWHLVANLPYNIATSLVLTVLDEVPAVSQLLVMCQREAAERLAAGPGTSAYGAVSVRVAIHGTAEVAGSVPSTVFYPRPEVESAMVRITRHSTVIEPRLRTELNRLVDTAFAHRRQMLRRTLRCAFADLEADAEEVFAAARIDSADRPERLGLPEWKRLAEASLGSGGLG